MTLDPQYFVTSDIDTYFVDKDSGLPLANGVLKFFRDSARTVSKNVYQLTGAPPNYTYTSLGSTITLSNVGTVQNAGGDNVLIYYNPYIVDPGSGKDVLDLYYIECYDQDGNLQFTREAWPNLPDETITQDLKAPLQNQISNPQFTNVFFSDGFTTNITLASASDQEIEIAPDWLIIASGSGAISVKRNTISGSSQYETSPPYSLDIQTNSGVTNTKLVQRIRKNSGLWSSTTNSDIFLSGSFLARNETAGTQSLSLYYKQSNPSNYTPILIAQGSFSTIYTYISGGTSLPIPSSSDSNLGDSGYVDIYIDIPDNAHVSVTSINVIPSFSKNETPPYSLDSSNRNEAYQGDWYIPKILSKTMDSFLVGWDFMLNPRQFFPQSPYNITLPPRNLAQYITDQTIAFGSDPVFPGFNWALNNSALTGLVIAKSPGGPNTFCVAQYLSGAVVRRLFENSMSVNFYGYSTGGNDITMRVYLFSGDSSAPAFIPTLNSFIGTLNTNGTFSLTASNWSAIPCKFDEQKAILVKNPTDPYDEKNNIGFNGWKKLNSTDDLFCIVVTFTGFSVSDKAFLTSISLVQGDIPCQPNKKTFSETLSQCQFYYNRNFGTYGVQASGASTLTNGPVISFPITMRTTPNVALINTNNPSSDQIRNVSRGTDWTNSDTNIFVLGTSSVTQQGFTTRGTTPAGSAVLDISEVGYSADARLGVV